MVIRRDKRPGVKVSRLFESSDRSGFSGFKRRPLKRAPKIQLAQERVTHQQLQTIRFLFLSVGSDLTGKVVMKARLGQKRGKMRARTTGTLLLEHEDD